MSTAAPNLPPGFPAMSIAQAHKMLTSAPASPFEVEERVIHGAKIKTWKNAPPSLAAVFEASAPFGARVYMVNESERVTFDAHRRAVSQLAKRLVADGVKKGDRVAIIMRNLPEWSVAFWAAILAGAIVTPLNAWWTGPELEYGLADSGTMLAIADAERWERLREHADNCPDLKRIYVSRSSDEISDPRVQKLEDIIGAPNSWAELAEVPLPKVTFEPEDDATIFYTSGTTGKPKGAVITHRNIISNFFNAMCAQARSFLRRGEALPVPDPAVQKSSLISVPFFHATGCFAVMMPAVLGGSKLVMQRRWNADQALELIERERITTAGGVPTIAWQIIEHPRFHEFDLSSLETISYGGAPSAPELVRRMKERFPNLKPGQGWGMTETSATATSNFAEDYERKPTSCGVPSPTGEVRIVGGDGKDVPVGDVGELYYRGPIVVRGYWNKPQATAETFVDGWVKTGDLAKVDEEGFVYIVDRAKDMLIRGGENIYCVEVENALYDHPAVMDAAVIGIPHRTLGEEPAAAVHLKAGAHATEEELRHFVAQKIAAFKVPVKILFLPETLPRNANGKIMKRDLKPLFGGLNAMTSWRVGDVKITKIVELEATGGTRFILPQATREAVLPYSWMAPHFMDDEGRLKMSIHALVIEAPGRRMIVDTCLGNDKQGRGVPTWNNLSGPFLRDLAAAGFARESIDTVMCTHLHVDHVGWNTMLVGGKWVPTFPNARYLMGRQEFDYWRDQRENEELISVFSDSVRPVFEAGLVDLVETDHRISPEISFVPTLGHTPGHVSVRISSKGEEALITGDFVHHPCQMARPDWAATVDFDQKASTQTRLDVFGRLAGTPTLVIGTHFAGPTAGRVVRDGDAFKLVV